MHEDIGTCEQLEEAVPVWHRPQVEPCTPFAQGHLRHDPGLVPVRRVDSEHVGAPSGQQPGGDRAGEHPGEVEYPQPVEWAARGAEEQRGCRLRCPLVEEQWFRGDCTSLGVLVPFGLRPHGRSRTSCGDDGGLEFVSVPERHRSRHI